MNNLRNLGGKQEPLKFPKRGKHHKKLSKAERKKVEKIANSVKVKKVKKKKIHLGRGFWKDTQTVIKQNKPRVAAAALAATGAVHKTISVPAEHKLSFTPAAKRP